MKNILITGGTGFVSQYAANYYVKKGDRVYTLNRNTRPQPEGTTLIEADRHALDDKLQSYHFDLILDVTAYNAEDVDILLDAVGGFGDYILISSSAVYPDSAPQPFTENTLPGANRFWRNYGTDKIQAENALLNRVPNAYILRPPYLYGPMNNLYREAFVFDCALSDRKFYLPGTGQMKLQFLHVEDLCRFVDTVLKTRPERHIFNVGNSEAISILDWVTLCYQAAGKKPEFVNVPEKIEAREYFSFYNYEYYLDVQEQTKLMPTIKPLQDGLQESLSWYLAHPEGVRKKPLIDYIEKNLR